MYDHDNARAECIDAVGRSPGIAISVFMAAWCVLLCLLSSGCAGPSTEVLPRSEAPEAASSFASPTPLPDASPQHLQLTINWLSSSPRERGSAGEIRSKQYIRQNLSEYGYEVRESGGIVTARKPVEPEDADLMFAVTNYGTAPFSPGAFDNASGTAVLLETARLLAGIETDTELRFVFLPGEENSLEAAQSYIGELDMEDRERILGAVQIGPLGMESGNGLALGTRDGNPTFLGEQLSDASMLRNGSALPFVRESRAIQNVFMIGRIPAVCLFEDHKAFEQGTPLDRAQKIDVSELAEAADMLSQAFYGLMDAQSPSMQAKAHFYNDLRDGAYVQGKEAVYPFGQTRETLELLTGQRGVLTAENTDNAGKSILAFCYPMKWFGVDQIILTYYYFLEGKLFEVDLDADGAGISFEEASRRVSSVYGEPTKEEETPSGIEYEWILPNQRLQILLTPGTGNYGLTFSEYDTPPTLLTQDSSEAKKLREMVSAVIPKEDLRQISISIYTDGVGETRCSAEALETALPTGRKYSFGGLGAKTFRSLGVPGCLISIDLQDALTEDGEWRHLSGTIMDLVDAYAQYLKIKNSERYVVPFVARFRRSMYGSESRPLAELGKTPGSQEPPLPDFTESFRWFVLSDLPEGELEGWGERIRYFYEFEELVSYRDFVQGNLRRIGYYAGED